MDPQTKPPPYSLKRFLWNPRHLVDKEAKKQLQQGKSYYDPVTKRTYNNYSDYYFRFDKRHLWNKARKDF